MTTASPSARARYRLPCPVKPLPLLLPAEDLMPGENFAHEHRCPAVGNRVMSTPISAMMIAAATGPIPGISSRRCTAWSKGAQVGLDLGVQHRNVGVDGIDPAQHAFQQE